MSQNVLNPELYRSIQVAFGSIKITKHRIPRKSQKILDPVTRRPTEFVFESGEQYCVNCPKCNDTRHRLSISYMWGVKDPVTLRQTNMHLVNCYNEDCDWFDFRNYLIPYFNRAPVMVVEPVGENVPMFKDVTFPGQCVPLNTLPTSHPAIQYVLGRGFDQHDLTANWGVHFCVHATEDENHCIPGTSWCSGLIRDRIVIPIYWEGRMVAWQCRSLTDKKPKYYTMPGFQKSQMVFNGDRARLQPYGVVVEGVLDAIRVGDCGVALLGKKLSDMQRRILCSYDQWSCCFFMLDGDAGLEQFKAVSSIGPAAFHYGVHSLNLPPDRDPAKCSRQDLHGMIYSYATSAGFPLAGAPRRTPISPGNAYPMPPRT